MADRATKHEEKNEVRGTRDLIGDPPVQALLAPRLQRACRLW
jgi:hypothetical protein